MPGDPVHARPVDAVLEELGVEPERGLAPPEVATRLREHGPNRLREAARRSVLRILADQFKSTVIVVLVVADALALAAGQWAESIAIAAVLAVNAGIGFTSEWRARRTMDALRRIAQPRARVRRDGEEREVAAEELVPGDILLVGPEDVLPADARVLAAEGLRVDESALTGESVPVDKGPEPVGPRHPLAERTCMLFKGTTVVDGGGEALVWATGQATELGRIAELAEEAEAAETPLEQRLDRLGRVLAFVALGAAAVIAAVGLASGKPALVMVETAVALGLAAIPEGLPIVATLALARGMWRMARRQAVIHHLAAVETLGSTGVIFSDKTGTLTENRMALRRVWTAAGAREPDGESPEAGGATARRALEIGALCSSASLGPDGPQGDPTEVALLQAAAGAGIDRDELLEVQPEVRRAPFERDVMMMATFHQSAGNAGNAGKVEVAVKGAPQAVLEVCDRVAREDGGEEPLDPQGRETWSEGVRELAAAGLRVLAVADKTVDDEGAPPYEGLRLVGLVGLLDPPREGVRAAIEACRSAGIRVLVVTGDQAETATAVAREVGLGAAEGMGVLLGSELPEDEEETSPELRERILAATVFARVSPEQKLGLVGTFQEDGHVVAMTGDGVNDAPALKKADIGIAMGRRGTDAAREVADMVLRDDAFSSIVAAVEQGRIIFANIRKSVLFMLCTNAAEVLAVAVASLAAIPLPLRPLQILYLNVLTDVFPALALAVGPGAPDAMRRPPRDPREDVLTRSHWLAIGGWSGVIGACVLGALGVALWRLGLEPLAAVTVSFLTLGLAKLWFVFNLRDPGSTLLGNDVVRNPWIWGAIALCLGLLAAAVFLPGLSDVLETRPLGLPGLAVALGASLVPFVAGQILRGVQAAGRGASSGEAGERPAAD